MKSENKKRLRRIQAFWLVPIMAFMLMGCGAAKDESVTGGAADNGTGTVTESTADEHSDDAVSAEEKTYFSVELTEAGPNKIKVIKVVREITGLGLKEAKEIVDGAPKVLKEGVEKAEADDIKAKLEAEGAKVTLK